MEFLSKGLIGLALAAVAIVLLFGLFNMMRGGDANLSQKLMRWRVIMQFVAVAVMMTLLYFTSK